MRKNLHFAIFGVIFLVLVSGCPKSAEKPSPSGQSTEVPSPSGRDKVGVNIDGAGATFPEPIYAQWAFRYGELTGLKINYQAVGSGQGVAAIKAQTVDFGASDAPLKSDELREAGLIQFPMVIGGVVPIFNIKGVGAGELRLTGELLARVFLGEVVKWNDRAIVEINPGLNLPDMPITVVHRADGSGTTWLFTNYLDKVSSKWHEKVGAGKSVSWPTGVGGQGNEGVTNMVKQIDGSIGYVEYAYAVQNNLSYGLLKNRHGNFVSPTIESFQAAASNANWDEAEDFYVVLVDQPGEQSWPITGASFILIRKDQPDAVKGEAMLKYFEWCYKHGAELAKELHYVPMPQNVVEMVEAVWREQVTSQGQKVWK